MSGNFRFLADIDDRLTFHPDKQIAWFDADFFFQIKGERILFLHVFSLVYIIL